MFNTLLKPSHLFFDDLELYIESFVKLDEAIHVVINLIQAAFYSGEAVLHLFDDGCITCTERSNAFLDSR